MQSQKHALGVLDAFNHAPSTSGLLGGAGSLEVEHEMESQMESAYRAHSELMPGLIGGGILFPYHSRGSTSYIRCKDIFLIALMPALIVWDVSVVLILDAFGTDKIDVFCTNLLEWILKFVHHLLFWCSLLTENVDRMPCQIKLYLGYFLCFLFTILPVPRSLL